MLTESSAPCLSSAIQPSAQEIAHVKSYVGLTCVIFYDFSCRILYYFHLKKLSEFLTHFCKIS